MNYFSPYLIVERAQWSRERQSHRFRLHVCGLSHLRSRVVRLDMPAAGLQEPLFVNARRVGSRADLVKWIIWVPWVALIVFAVWRAGGYRSVDPLYGTVGGISVAGDADRPVIVAYVIYLGVTLLFFGLAARARPPGWLPLGVLDSPLHDHRPAAATRSRGRLCDWSPNRRSAGSAGRARRRAR